MRSLRLDISTVLVNEKRMNDDITHPTSRWLMPNSARMAGMAGPMTAESSAAMKTPSNKTLNKTRGELVMA